MPRKNISLHQAVEDRAAEIIRTRGFSGLSNLIEVLIREEFERRHPPMIPHDAAISSSPGQAAAERFLNDAVAHARAAASAPPAPGKSTTYKAPRKTKPKPTP